MPVDDFSRVVARIEHLLSLEQQLARSGDQAFEGDLPAAALVLLSGGLSELVRRLVATAARQAAAEGRVGPWVLSWVQSDPKLLQACLAAVFPRELIEQVVLEKLRERADFTGRDIEVVFLGILDTEPPWRFQERPTSTSRATWQQPFPQFLDDLHARVTWSVAGDSPQTLYPATQVRDVREWIKTARTFASTLTKALAEDFPGSMDKERLPRPACTQRVTEVSAGNNPTRAGLGKGQRHSRQQLRSAQRRDSRSLLRRPPHQRRGRRHGSGKQPPVGGRYASAEPQPALGRSKFTSA